MLPDQIMIPFARVGWSHCYCNMPSSLNSCPWTYLKLLDKPLSVSCLIWSIDYDLYIELFIPMVLFGCIASDNGESIILERSTILIIILNCYGLISSFWFDYLIDLNSNKQSSAMDQSVVWLMRYVAVGWIFDLYSWIYMIRCIDWFHHWILD